MNTKTKICPSCKTEFKCGETESDKTCWCSRFPMIIKLEPGQQCLCPDCLQQLVSDKISSFVTDFKNGKIENIAPQFRSKQEKLVVGIDFYIEHERWVFTEWYHLKKGSCCGNGCRHCPY